MTTTHMSMSGTTCSDSASSSSSRDMARLRAFSTCCKRQMINTTPGLHGMQFYGSSYPDALGANLALVAVAGATRHLADVAELRFAVEEVLGVMQNKQVTSQT